MTRYLLHFLWTSVPAVLLFIAFYPYRKKCLTALNLNSSILREIGLVAFVMCIGGVIGLKLIPFYYQECTSGLWGDIRLLINRPTWDAMLHYIPFTMISDYLSYAFEGTSDIASVLTNLVGNLILFIPIGFLSALLFQNPNWKRSVLIGMGISLFSEIGQYFIMRNASVDDLILNTTGTLIGFWIYRLLRANKSFAQHFHCQPLFSCIKEHHK